MIPGGVVKDLIVLTADKSMKLGVEGLLGRPKELGIRALTCDIIFHPRNDPGVIGNSHDFLRPECKRYTHAIAMCDREGCGKTLAREELEEWISQRLRVNGWEDRSAAVVIDPELESWVWGDWNLLAASIPWGGDGRALKAWLTEKRLLEVDQMKPSHPKEALQAAMRYVRIPFTSAVHQRMGARGSFETCTDPAFLKLRSTLQQWFPLR